jgi:Co/Zn/Cd efflux system component
MSDAAHMFSDVFSMVVSVHCMRLIERKADASYSFGYHRAETIGALVSVLTVCAITGGLVVEAMQRLMNPQMIDGRLMFTVASIGIAFNLVLLFTLGHDHDHGHGHSHGTCGHRDHGAGSLTGTGRRTSHTHSQSDELSTIRVSNPGREDEALTEADQTAEVPVVTNGHSHCSHDHNHDHSHDHSTHAHDHSHDHVHGSSCEHSLAQSQSHDLPLIHTQTHSCAHSHHHDHSHHGGHHHDHENQNLRGAILHVIGDFMQSVGVAAAGAVIWCASLAIAMMYMILPQIKK